MTPSRESMTRQEIVQLVHDIVDPLFREHNQKIDLRLTAQDITLAEIKSKQDSFHAENRRRLDLVEKDTKNILQFHELEQQRQKIEREAADKRDKSWDRWKTRITLAAAIMTLFSALGIGNYIHQLFLSGHLFPPVH